LACERSPWNESIPRPRQFRIYFASVKAYKVSLAPTRIYCLPSSSHVDGGTRTPACNFACQSGSPVVALRASRNEPGAPVNIRLPAVESRPELPPPSQGWLHVILPV